MVVPFIYRIRYRKGYVVTWLVVVKKRFLRKEIPVGKVAFDLWMSDN